MLATAIQLAGFVCLAVAAFMVSQIAGLILTGLELILIGHALDGIELHFQIPKRHA